MLYVHRQEERQRQNHKPISAISLAQAEEGSSEAYRPLTAADKVECCEDTAGRFRSRTGSLLEFQVHENRRQRALDETDSLVLEVMHSTVFGFLEDSNVWNLPSLKMADDTYVKTSFFSIVKLRDCI